MKLDNWPMIEAVSNLDRLYIATSFAKFYPNCIIEDLIMKEDPVFEQSLLNSDVLVQLILQSPTLDKKSEYRGYTILKFSLKHGMTKSVGVFRTIRDHWEINPGYRTKT